MASTNHEGASIPKWWLVIAAVLLFGVSGTAGVFLGRLGTVTSKKAEQIRSIEKVESPVDRPFTATWTPPAPVVTQALPPPAVQPTTQLPAPAAQPAAAAVAVVPESGSTAVPIVTPPPVTPVVTPPAPPVSAPPQKSMPADVRDWLKHLEKTEGQRKSLATGQLSSLITQFATLISLGATRGLLDDAEATDGRTPGSRAAGIREVEVRIQAQRRQWKDIVITFESVRPPSECEPTAESYDRALTETSAMADEVLAQLATGLRDPETAISALTRMQGTSDVRIDANAKAADRGVQQICDLYGEEKWFSVSGDFGSSFMKLFGGL